MRKNVQSCTILHRAIGEPKTRLEHRQLTELRKVQKLVSGVKGIVTIIYDERLQLSERTEYTKSVDGFSWSRYEISEILDDFRFQQGFGSVPKTFINVKASNLQFLKMWKMFKKFPIVVRSKAAKIEKELF